MAKALYGLMIHPQRILETGLWCTECALPSGISYEYRLTWPDGVSAVVGTLVGRVCVECQGMIRA